MEVRDMLNSHIEISIDDVRSHFRRVNPHKAHGPDYISCKALRVCVDQLARPFQRLFQQSIDTGVVPKLWKRSTIVAVPKNNRPKELNNLLL